MCISVQFSLFKKGQYKLIYNKCKCTPFMQAQTVNDLISDKGQVCGCDVYMWSSRVSFSVVAAVMSCVYPLD